MELENYLQENYRILLDRIENACEKTCRAPNEIDVIAVSKKINIREMLLAYNFGITQFGENYLQDAIKKISSFPSKLKNQFYFIGNIQSNKLKLISLYFDWVLSVTSIYQAEQLGKYRLINNQRPINVCIQINLPLLKRDTGLPFNQIDNILKKIVILPGIKLRGFMLMPDLQKDPIIQKMVFNQSKCIFDLYQERYHLDTLSMGTSQDFEEAIISGATQIRVGEILFNKNLIGKTN